MFTHRTIRIAGFTLAATALALAAAPAAAQQDSSQAWANNCHSNWSGDWSRFCEVRTLTLPVPSGAPLSVDGLENGFTVQGKNAGRMLTTMLGQGGALIHVATHNGGVHVRRSL